VPYRINEGRIADFLVSQLEGIDKTSTFFEEVFRLPPAHALSVTPEGVREWRYWTLEPGPELRLATDQDYAEAFLEVFTEAVRCRLRSAGPVGSMLSGGMDSGSVTAIAREILAETGQGPLPTFSAVGPDPDTCVETRTIHAALTMDGLDPHLVSFADLDPLMPELEVLTWDVDEPFDSGMTLIRAIYLAAHVQGLKVVLDGVGGDTVLSEGPTSPVCCARATGGRPGVKPPVSDCSGATDTASGAPWDGAHGRRSRPHLFAAGSGNTRCANAGVSRKTFATP
jgi:asparagine synthase (glutamine-hydrolysing)